MAAIRRNARTNKHNVKAAEMVRLLRKEAYSLRQIAGRLTEQGACFPLLPFNTLLNLYRNVS